MASSVPEDDGTGVLLRAGLGVGRYSETAPGVLFDSDVQPQVQAGVDGAWKIGTGLVVLQAAATFGTQVHMSATQNGMLVQNNDFRMQLYEASPRLRWPLNPRLAVDLGYRLTYQRLFFLGIPSFGDVEEDVTVHAAELGLLYHRATTDGGRLHVAAGIGLNHGSAQNDHIMGGDFSAGGHSFWIRTDRTWASGLTIGVAWTTRSQDGSSSQNVTVMGMQGTAFWPQNTTWSLFALAGYTI